MIVVDVAVLISVLVIVLLEMGPKREKYASPVILETRSCNKSVLNSTLRIMEVSHPASIKSHIFSTSRGMQ